MKLDERKKPVGREALPWLILAIVAGLAVWQVFDFAEARETDFPKVVREFHNPLSPKVYRLAEPGDTLDRIGLYLSSFVLAVGLVAVGSRLQDKTKPLALWPSALAVSLAATWFAATPGPTFDGWPGLGWRVIFDPLASFWTRLAVGSGAVVLIGILLANLAKAWPDRQFWLARSREIRIRALLVTAALLIGLRAVDIPMMSPVGYWPRVAFDLGILAFGFVLLRAQPLAAWPGKFKPKLTLAISWGVLVVAGVALMLYHRPLARLHAVVPGKIYISAMPSYLGLSIEQERLHFRTIINLFDEASTEASPYHEDEIRFVREHNLRYLGSPSDGLESDRFLDETLQLAQNPDAWPILVHCHGCMDRSPAWMGIYRFVVERKPLAEIFAEIERHRGSRPKAVVTLQYNRKLPVRAPEQFANDPTARRLHEALAGTRDPFLRPNWNATATTRRVVTRIDPDPNIRRP
jgi:hypothetical protein